MAKTSASKAGRKGSPARPKGRSLADFEPLRPAEERLLAACAWGSSATAAGKEPIRAGFVRFLILGGDEETPIHEYGVRIAASTIEGVLDLSGCAALNPVLLVDCRIEGGILCRDAALVGLTLSGSKVKFLDGTSLRCAGGLRLDGRFVAREGVNLHRALVDGDIYCGAAVLAGGDSYSALDLSDAQIAGNVYLTEGFRATAEVNLARAQIRGSLLIHRAELSDGRSPFALVANEIEIGATLYLRSSAVKGVTLAHGHARTLSDDAASWGGPLVLDQFLYERLRDAPTGAKVRIPWLLMQETDGGRFFAHPWEHLYRILRDSGHSRDATRIAIAKQRERRRLGLVGQREVTGVPFGEGVTNRLLNGLERVAHRAYGIFAGYGHRKVQGAAIAALTVWLVAAALFGAGSGYFGPSDGGLVAQRESLRCGYGGEPGKNPWTACRAMPPEYPRFHALMYSGDLILPFLDLQQERYWAPIVADKAGNPLGYGRWLRGLMWMEILFGWGVVGYLVSLIGKLAGREPGG